MCKSGRGGGGHFECVAVSQANWFHFNGVDLMKLSDEIRSSILRDSLDIYTVLPAEAFFFFLLCFAFEFRD